MRNPLGYGMDHADLTKSVTALQCDATLKTMIRGTARDSRERFDFTIQPFVLGGFRLDISFSGDGRSNETGAGIWPTIDKAKAVAEETASRLLHGESVIWSEDSN